MTVVEQVTTAEGMPSPGGGGRDVVVLHATRAVSTAAEPARSTPGRIAILQDTRDRAMSQTARQGARPAGRKGDPAHPDAGRDPAAQSGDTIFSGRTYLSKSSGFTRPSSAAAARRVMFLESAS